MDVIPIVNEKTINNLKSLHLHAVIYRFSFFFFFFFFSKSTMNSNTIMEVYFDTKPGTFRTPLDCLNARGIFSALKLFGRYDGDNYDTM